MVSKASDLEKFVKKKKKKAVRKRVICTEPGTAPALSLPSPDISFKLVAKPVAR